MLTHERLGIIECASEHLHVLTFSICDAVRTFLSATSALRFRPRSFARFMGEPLNETESSSGVIASRARTGWRASFPASTSRGANAGSFNSCASFTLYGQHGWEMYRQYRFEIPLGTGSLTLRNKRT